jgi:hypothetical protein
MSQGDADTLMKALDYALALRRDDARISRHMAAEEAAKRFDLGPADEEWLLNQLTERKPPE